MMLFEKYNSLSGWNLLNGLNLVKFLFKGMISILDPVGEGIETAVKIGTKTGGKDGAKLARLGGVASNWRYEVNKSSYMARNCSYGCNC